MSVAWVGVAVAAAGTAYSANQSKKSAKSAAKSATNELEFQQAQYDDWQNTYGSLEENLSEYYNSISAESFAAAGLENQEQAFETSMANINQSLAQRGITNTAVGESLSAQAEIQNAEAKAEIRTEAPVKAAEAQSNFLQIGMGNDPTSSLTNTMSNRTSYLQQVAAQQEAATADSYAATAKTGLSAASDSYNEE